MRYSTEKKLGMERWKLSTNAAFFKAVAEHPDTKAEHRRCSILLVGGADERSLALRKAQSWLRLDQQPSYWSHAALILHWPDGDWRRAIGVEVTLDPENPVEQVPERNGVTFFRLGRYADQRRYPNVCVASFELAALPEQAGGTRDPKQAIEDAALAPNRDRLRYPLWTWLGEWARHVLGASSAISLDGVPMPSAALCEYAFEAAQIDLAPGSSTPQSSPESLWSNLLYWSKSMHATGIGVKAFAVTRQEAPHRKPLSVGLAEDFDRLRRTVQSR